MADLIVKARAKGIQVWADYGAPDWPSLGTASTSFPMRRLNDVITYNAANPTAKFDGVILDVEWASSGQYGSLNTFLNQLLSLNQAYLNTGKPSGLQIGAALQFFWNPVYWSPPSDVMIGNKAAYQAIIDLGLDQLVVMGYRDFAGNIPSTEGEDGIIGFDQDEVNYAASVHTSSQVLAGLETQNISPS